MDDKAIYRAFGRAVADRRKAIAKTQQQVANDIGLSRASLANIERGSQKVFLHQILALSNALGLESAHEIVPSKVVPTRDHSKADYQLSGATGLSRDQKALVSSLVSALIPHEEIEK